MGTNYYDTVYNFVPNGAKVTVVRDVVKTATCNKCHDQMAFHGGSRRSVELCVLCHQAQSVDPDTGNTVDMAVFIHKIHAGSSLPSVQGGKPYQIIGHGQSVADYSDIAFPADIRSCTTCHDPAAGAAQQANYTKPSRAACGSCHDTVNFATGANHVNLPQVSDSQCSQCHPATGLGPRYFDLGRAPDPAVLEEPAGRRVPVERRGGQQARRQREGHLHGEGQAGQPGGAERPDPSEPPDHRPQHRLRSAGRGGGLRYRERSEGESRGPGQYSYTFTKALPADAKGSYTVAIEGRREVKLHAGHHQGTAGARYRREQADGLLGGRKRSEGLDASSSPTKSATRATARWLSTAITATT